MPRPTSTTPTQLLIAHDTHAGARGKNNEDSYDVFAVPLHGPNGVTSAQAMTVAVVADGVTSHTGGAQASQLAAKTVRALLEKGLADGPRPKQLEDVILRANREIYTFAQTNTVMENMSTTLVLAAVEDQRLYALHVGDSRVYLIRSHAIYQLTLDHTWVQKAIDEGRITAAEAKVHPNRHVIVRYLGIDQRVTIDQEIILPDTTQPNGQRAMGDNLQLKPGDAILLCTDGLTDQVKDEEIADAVRHHWLNPKAAVKQLIELALKRQEPDNITVVLIELPDRKSLVPALLHKPLLALTGLAGILMVGLYLFGGNLMSSMGLQSTATPPAVAIANPAVQAVTTTTPTPVSTATPTAMAIPAATAVATPIVITVTATLPPTITNTPITEAVTALATSPVATQTLTVLPPPAATETLLATATLAPTATATPTPIPSPTPQTIIGLTSPINRATVTGPTEFQWSITNPAANVITFRLSLWPLNQQDNRVEIPIGNTNAHTATVDLNSSPGGLALVNNVTYRWQVQLISPAGVVVNSDIGEFSYLAPTPVPTATQASAQPSEGNNNDNNDDDNKDKDNDKLPGGDAP